MDTTSGISWYYTAPSEVLYTDEDRRKVGILNSNPRYELDVNGTIYANTYCNLPPFALSNDIFNLANYTSNNMVVNGTVVTLSNLNVLNTIQRNGSNIVGTNGKIDYVKWLSNCPSYSNDDSMAIAGIVLGALGLVSGLGGLLLTQTGAGTKLIEDLNKKLGGDVTEAPDYDPNDGNADEDALRVHWNSINYPPIYTTIGKTDVGFSSNTYHSSKSKLVKLLYSSYMDTDGGRIRRMNTGPGRTKTIFDFETENLFCETVQTTSNIQSSNVYTSNAYISRDMTACNLTASNAIVLSNLQAPYLVGFDIQTNTFSGNQVRVGDFYVRGDGVWYGNPANPFTAVQVIDGAGNYVGQVNKEQVRGLESWSLNKAADGLLEWSSFQTTTMPEYFDPFTNSTTNPLFDI